MLCPFILASSAAGCADWKKTKYEFKTGATSSPQVVDTTPTFACETPFTSSELASKVTQLLFGRMLSAEEQAAAVSPDFDFNTYVKNSLSSSESEVGVGRFVASLLDLPALLPSDDDTSAESLALLGDLRQEPIVLVLRNRDKPWSYFFTTSDIYCTKRTASIYGVTAENSEETFFSCKLPEDRAGFFGLASFLRAHPSAHYLVNNNYGRAAKVAYLSQGIRLTGDPFRDQGEPGGLPLAACVPRTDTRKDLTNEPFGTVSVAEYGSVCAGCHSNYLGPLSVAFRRYDPKGLRLDLEALEKVPQTPDAVLNDIGLLATLLEESQSCWSNDIGSEPKPFDGLAGLAALAGTSTELARAVALQVPDHFAKQTPNENSTFWIKKTFEEGNKTIDDAIEGFLKSDSFRCKVPAKESAISSIESSPGTCDEEALATFSTNIGPVISKVCGNCHSVGSGGMFLKSDDHLNNRLNLLAFLGGDAKRLEEKISSAKTHGGGDRSADLPTSTITVWTFAEKACGNLDP